MNDTFWGLALVALAIAVGARGIFVALMAIATRLEVRNAMLSLIGKGARVTAISSSKPAP